MPLFVLIYFWSKRITRNHNSREYVKLRELLGVTFYGLLFVDSVSLNGNGTENLHYVGIQFHYIYKSI